MKNPVLIMSQNHFRVLIAPGLATEKIVCVIRRLLTPVLIMAFAIAIGVTVLHHHEDGESHSDCTLCLLLIQPAIADNVEDSSVRLFLASPENPSFIVGSLTSLYAKVVPCGRAPPPSYN